MRDILATKILQKLNQAWKARRVVLSIQISVGKGAPAWPNWPRLLIIDLLTALYVATFFSLDGVRFREVRLYTGSEK